MNQKQLISMRYQIMITFTLPVTLRVRTASGDAMFAVPGTDIMLDADEKFAAKWYHIPEGAVVTLCAKFEKTDTFMVAIATKGEPNEDGEVEESLNGVVLRRKSYEKIVEACETSALESNDEPEVGEPEVTRELEPEVEVTSTPKRSRKSRAKSEKNQAA